MPLDILLFTFFTGGKRNNLRIRPEFNTGGQGTLRSGP